MSFQQPPQQTKSFKVLSVTEAAPCNQIQAHIAPVVVACRVVVDVVAVPVALPIRQATSFFEAARGGTAHWVCTVGFIGSARINSGRIAGSVAGTWTTLGRRAVPDGKVIPQGRGFFGPHQRRETCVVTCNLLRESLLLLQHQTKESS